MIEKVKVLKQNKYISLITYALVLWFVLFNYTTVYKWLKYIVSLFVPLLIGLVIAFILNIPMSKIEALLQKKLKMKKTRGISITITLILFGIILSLLISIVIPKLITSFATIGNNVYSYRTSLISNVNNICASMGINYKLAPNFLEESIKHVDIAKIVKLNANSIMDTVLNTFGFFSVFFTAMISFIMSLYLLGSKEKYLLQARKVIVYIFGRKVSETLFDLISEANYYFNGFITGQLIEMILFSIMVYIPFRLFGLPFPELMAVIVGFCSLIPMFGCMISFSINFLIVCALSTQFVQVIQYTLTFIIIQQIEANVLYPKVVGKAVGISGIFVILAISVFSKMFGFVGLLIAVPCMALIYAVLSRLVNITLYRRRLDVTLDSIKDLEVDDDIPTTYRGH